MPKEYVVDGAKLECIMGNSPSNLKVLPTRKEKLTNKCQANINDCKPMVNVPSFGDCSSMFNPIVAAATTANNGVLKPMKCIPACSIWIGGKSDHLVEGIPALMKGDKAVCPLAPPGLFPIEVKDSGQGSGSSGNSWYNPDGSMNYPPNDGAVPGTEKTITLQPGDSVERLGEIGPNSNFVTAPGASPDSLSLPPTTDPNISYEIQVLKPIPNVTQSTVAPWGGSTGGGIQYVLPDSLINLEKNGFINIIKK